MSLSNSWSGVAGSIRRARHRPEAPAIIQGSRVIRFGEFIGQGRGLARLLRQNGVGIGDRVGIWTDRIPEHLVGQLGILEAGAAYVPLAVDEPVERAKFILEDGSLAHEELQDREAIARLIREHGVSHAFATPAFWNVLAEALEREKARLRWACAGGERLTRDLWQRLGEIEECLLSHPEIKAGIVIVREESAGKRLVAYVVGRESCDLKGYLRDRLPPPMAPSTIVFLDQLPLTQSGKVDRRALPDPVMEQEESRVQDDASLGRIERQMLDYFRGVIGSSRVGPADDFFEAGGDSLGAMQVVAKAVEAGLNVTIRDLMRHRTVLALAGVLRPREPKENSDLLAGAGDVVIEQADGLAAIAAYDSHRPDWVIMDVMMPVLDGLSATAKIKAAHPDARIVLVTQETDPSFQHAAVEAGANAFFSKEDLSKVRVYLDQAR